MHKLLAHNEHPVSTESSVPCRVTARLLLIAFQFVLAITSSCSRSPTPPQSAQGTAVNAAPAANSATPTQQPAKDERPKSPAEQVNARKQLTQFYEQTLSLRTEDKQQLAAFVDAYWPYCDAMDYVSQSIRCQIALLMAEEDRVMSAIISGRLSKDFSDLYSATVDVGSLNALESDLRLPSLSRWASADSGGTFEVAQAFKPVKQLWMGAEFRRRIAFDRVRNDDILRVARMIKALRGRDVVLKEKQQDLDSMRSELQAIGVAVQALPVPARPRPLTPTAAELAEDTDRVTMAERFPKPCGGLIDIIDKPRPPANPWQYPTSLTDIETRFAQVMDRLGAEEAELVRAAAP